VDNSTKNANETKDALEKKIAFYESQLCSTLDQVTRGILVGKIETAKKQIKNLNAKSTMPKKIKKRIEDPTVGERKKKKAEYDGRGSVINTGTGVYTFML